MRRDARDASLDIDHSHEVARAHDAAERVAQNEPRCGVALPVHLRLERGQLAQGHGRLQDVLRALEGAHDALDRLVRGPTRVEEGRRGLEACGRQQQRAAQELGGA